MTEAICRETPIRFDSAKLCLRNQNDWHIELFRRDARPHSGLLIYPTFNRAGAGNHICEILPLESRTFRHEIVELENADGSWPTALAQINMATRTIFKIFQIDNVIVRATSNLGIMNLSVWLRCNNFKKIVVDSGRSLTHGELRFILKLKTEELSIFPQVEPGMWYNGQLRYKSICLKDATWLTGDGNGNGLLQINAEKIEIAESTYRSFTVTKIREYMQQLETNSYNSLKVMKISVDTEGLSYEEMFNELTQGMHLLEVDSVARWGKTIRNRE